MTNLVIKSANAPACISSSMSTEVKVILFKQRKVAKHLARNKWYKHIRKTKRVIPSPT